MELVSKYSVLGGLLLLGIVIGALPLILPLLLSPRYRGPKTGDTYECGMDTIGSSWFKFGIAFYLFALIFVAFEVDILYLFPIAVVYGEAALARFRGKLGLLAHTDDDDGALVQDVFDWLGKEETDMTIFFRSLGAVVTRDEAPAAMPAETAAAFYGEPSQGHVDQGVAWLQRWWQRTRLEPAAPEEIATQLQRTNPKFVLRNWLSQTAIEATEKGDLSVLERLYRVMQRPFDEQPEHDDLAQKRPEWARHKPGCSALSCSS